MIQTVSIHHDPVSACDLLLQKNKKKEQEAAEGSERAAFFI